MVEDKPSRQEVREYYDKEFHPGFVANRRPSRDYASFLRSIRQFITPGMYFLDVGCGLGYLLRAAQAEGLTSVGVDISQSALNHARSNSPSSLYVLAYGEAIPFRKTSLHCIVCYGYLEHFQSPANGIGEVNRILKEKWLFRLSVPNSQFCPEKMGFYKGTGQILETSYSLAEWSRMLKENGFQIVSLKRDFGPPIFKNLKILGIISRIFLKIACLAPLRYNYQFIFIARKESSPT